jgi:hypothetical protein
LAVSVVIGGGALAVISASADPYGYAFRDVSGVRIWVQVSGFASANTKVSGTNVRFVVSTGFGPAPPGQSWPDPWVLDRVNLQAAPPDTQLTANGENIPPPPNASGVIVWEINEQFQTVLASTKYQDGSIVTVRFKARYRGEHVSGAISYQDVEVAITLVTYNKALQLATQVPPNSPEAAAARIAVTSVGPHLTAMKHTVKPTPYDGATSLARAALLSGPPPLLSEPTVFFAITHGDATGLYDSFTAPTPQATGVMTWSEISSAIGNRGQAIPPFNLVFLAACYSGAPNWQNQVAAAFGISSGSIAQVFGGFGNALAAGTGNATIEKYCEKLFAALEKGYTMDKAINIAGSPAEPRTVSGTSMRPRTVGDRMTKLMGAHGLLENEDRLKWYRIYKLPH